MPETPAPRLDLWNEICAAIDGFRLRHGSWPTHLRLEAEDLRRLREELLDAEGFLHLEGKLALRPDGDGPPVAEDDAGRSYRAEPGERPRAPDTIEAGDWLGVHPVGHPAPARPARSGGPGGRQDGEAGTEGTLRPGDASPVEQLRRRIEETFESVGDAASQIQELGERSLREVQRELGERFEWVRRQVSGEEAGARPAARVEDVMCRDVTACAPADSLASAARIMWDRDCGCVPVVTPDGSGRVVGMLTDRDAAMAGYTAGEPLAAIPVERAMARQVRTCRPDDPLSTALALMSAAQLRRLPVVDAEGRLQGILSLADVARRPGASPTEVAVALRSICSPRSGAGRRGARRTPPERSRRSAS